jgi:hypothetical protein
MWKVIASYLVRHTSFLYFCLFGAAGVLLDLDHLVQIFIPVGVGRVFHPALIVICWISLGCFCALIAGLYINVVLKSKVERSRQSKLTE